MQCHRRSAASSNRLGSQQLLARSPGRSHSPRWRTRQKFLLGPGASLTGTRFRSAAGSGFRSIRIYSKEFLRRETWSIPSRPAAESRQRTSRRGERHHPALTRSQRGEVESGQEIVTLKIRMIHDDLLDGHARRQELQEVLKHAPYRDNIPYPAASSSTTRYTTSQTDVSGPSLSSITSSPSATSLCRTRVAFEAEGPHMDGKSPSEPCAGRTSTRFRELGVNSGRRSRVSRGTKVVPRTGSRRDLDSKDDLGVGLPLPHGVGRGRRRGRRTRRRA